jgi:hypothetical protein
VLEFVDAGSITRSLSPYNDVKYQAANQLYDVKDPPIKIFQSSLIATA